MDRKAGALPGGFSSFDELVARYEKPVFNIAYRMLGNYDEAADVTQETFINAYRNLHRFRGESNVFTWLYQIAVNLCRNRLRKRGRQERREAVSLDAASEDPDGKSAKEIPDLSAAPHTVVERNELREKIVAAIEALPPDYREVIVLREFQGLSYNEIVAVTGISLDNVKTRLSRARAMLRHRVGPYYRGVDEDSA